MKKVSFVYSKFGEEIVCQDKVMDKPLPGKSHVFSVADGTTSGLRSGSWATELTSLFCERVEFLLKLDWGSSIESINEYVSGGRFLEEANTKWIELMSHLGLDRSEKSQLRLQKKPAAATWAGGVIRWLEDGTIRIGVWEIGDVSTLYVPVNGEVKMSHVDFRSSTKALMSFPEKYPTNLNQIRYQEYSLSEGDYMIVSTDGVGPWLLESIENSESIRQKANRLLNVDCTNPKGLVTDIQKCVNDDVGYFALHRESKAEFLSVPTELCETKCLSTLVTEKSLKQPWLFQTMVMALLCLVLIELFLIERREREKGVNLCSEVRLVKWRLPLEKENRVKELGVEKETLSNEFQAAPMSQLPRQFKLSSDYEDSLFEEVFYGN